MNNRPVNLDLTTVKMPFTAVLSIIHRITGVIIFFGVPFFLWLLQQSLSSALGFARVSDLVASGFFRLAFFAVMWAFAYHIMAGIKHLLMDLGHGETIKGAKISSALLVVGNLIVLVALGVAL